MAKKKKGMVEEKQPPASTTAEWIFIAVLVGLECFVLFEMPNLPEHDKAIIDGMLLGFAGLSSANVLTRLYNTAIPNFLSALRTNPAKTRIFGGIVLVLSLLLFAYR